MIKIEVQGSFLFEAGKVFFSWEDKTIAFSDITTIEQLRAVLIAIAQHSAQKSMEQILKTASANTSATVSKTDAFTRAKEQMDQALADSERSFREHQRRTSEALKQAEKDFEASTAVNPVTGRSAD